MFSLSDLELLQSLATKQDRFDLLQHFIEQPLTKVNDFVTDEENVESISKEYFNTEIGFDIRRFELHKVPILCDSKDIIRLFKCLTRQHSIISKKLLLLILQKHLEYKVELNEILKIKKNIKLTLMACKVCRNNLISATEQISTSSLKILFYFRKKKNFKSLLEILYTIRTLWRTRYRLKYCINEENYHEVISLISKYHEEAGTTKKYDCIVALRNNLNDTLDQIEENLDQSLSKICNNFDVNKYSAIQDAYNFLGKSQSAIDQLHMHFMAAINITALNSVQKYTNENMQKEYKSLCQTICLENFMFCLIDLCKSLLFILESYYLIIKWHENNKKQDSMENEGNYLILNKKYTLQKLENGIKKICNDIENKIIIYLDGFNLMALKFEEFIKVLIVIDRISKLERKICKKYEPRLHEFIREKFVNYFNNYHASRLEELKIFLENESWKLCPVKATFKIYELQEFRTFKYISNLHHVNNVYQSSHKSNNDEEVSADNIGDTTFSFDFISYESMEEDILRNYENITVGDSTEDSDDEIPEELKLDYVDEFNTEKIYKKKRKYAGPIITNTSLSLLRIFGKYLQVTRFFYDYNKTVVQYIAQIFELYFYVVYTFFTIDYEVNDSVLSTNIKRTISRIKDGLFVNYNKVSDNSNLINEIQPPYSTESINLNDSKTLFGLSERIVAIESLIFLGIQYGSFRTYLYSITLNNEDNTYLNLFYNNTVSLTIQLRKPIYMGTIFKFFDATNILNLMSKVNWELKDIVSQHNNYIDILIKEICKFEEALRDVQNIVSISKEVYESIWENIAYFITHTMVEGFSNATKCSYGGRALMQLDFTQFSSKFETVTSLRPMPHRDYVTTYIKAYYLPESNLESWIKEHLEYSLKHLNGLISSMYQNKKIRQKFMTFIEDQRCNK